MAPCPTCGESLMMLEREVTGVRMRGYQCVNDICPNAMLYFDEKQVTRLAAVVARRKQEGRPSGFEETSND
jgi:hypothetical protein